MKSSLNSKRQLQINTHQDGTFWVAIKRFFCPCLVSKAIGSAQNSYLKNQLIDSSSVQSRFDSEMTHKELRGEMGKPEVLKSHSKIRKRSQELRQSKEDSENCYQRQANESYRGTMQLSVKNKLKAKDEMEWSVWTLPEDQLTAVGSPLYSVLVKVTSAQPKPNFGKLKQLITRSSAKFYLSKPHKRKDLLYKNYQFDRFWQDRYLFFDKFDQGIKIDEQSWETLPPQSICEYIASKFAGRHSILDAFAGVGAISMKLATLNSCSKVTANEPNQEKLSFLLSNASIYEVDSYLQLSNSQFLKLGKRSFDAVFMQPPLADLQARSSKGMSLNDFSPSLDEVIGKSMTLSGNLVMLLPPQINIEQICSCLSKWGSRLKWMRDFCSVLVQKIIWKAEIKYVLVCVGKYVQTEVKLNDQLDYIYSKLRNCNERYFKQKKIVKKIREEHGMADLFNAVKQALARKKQHYFRPPNQGPPTIEYFYQVILEKNFISEDRLNKIKLEQEQIYEKKESLLNSLGLNDQSRVSPCTEEEKIEDNPAILRQAELTSSEYSYASYFQTLSKGSKSKGEAIGRFNTLQSGMGVIIKRSQGDSQPNYSRKNTNNFSEKGQDSNKEKQSEGGSAKRTTELSKRALTKKITKEA